MPFWEQVTVESGGTVVVNLELEPIPEVTSISGSISGIGTYDWAFVTAIGISTQHCFFAEPDPTGDYVIPVWEGQYIVRLDVIIEPDLFYAYYEDVATAAEATVVDVTTSPAENIGFSQIFFGDCDFEFGQTLLDWKSNGLNICDLAQLVPCMQ